MQYNLEICKSINCTVLPIFYEYETNNHSLILITNWTIFLGPYVTCWILQRGQMLLDIVITYHFCTHMESITAFTSTHRPPNRRKIKPAPWYKSEHYFSVQCAELNCFDLRLPFLFNNGLFLFWIDFCLQGKRCPAAQPVCKAPAAVPNKLQLCTCDTKESHTSNLGACTSFLSVSSGALVLNVSVFKTGPVLAE